MSSPLPPQPAIQTAAHLLAQGRPDEAAERLGALAAQTPTYAAAHVLHATALEAAGRLDDALAAWGRAAALVPRSPLVQRKRAHLLDGRPAEGEPAAPLVTALGASPSEPDDEGPLATDDRQSGDAPPAPEPEETESTDDAAPAAPLDAVPEAEALPTDQVDDGPDWAPGPDWLVEEDLSGVGSSDGTGQDPGPPEANDWIDLPEGTGLPAPLPEPGVDEPSPGSTGAPSVADELDSLISQLEDAPRIRPDPSFNGPAVSLDTGEVDEMASETLAKIYAAQGRYAEAAAVYDTLAARQPERAAEFRTQAEEMRRTRG